MYPTDWTNGVLLSSYKVMYEAEEVSPVERRQEEDHHVLLWTPIHGR